MKQPKTPHIRISKSEAEMLYKELGKVRAWLSGFAAGRTLPGQISFNAGPPSVDSLRQIQVLLKGEIHDR